MSRWADDPDRAADALIERCLDELALGVRLLLVNPGAGLERSLQQRDLAYAVWNRRLTGQLTGGHAAAPWPPAGPFDAALVRLPKARDEQRMSVHASLGVLARGGRLILYGGNDEGIRPAARMLEEVCGGATALASRGHGRVLAAVRPERTDMLQGSLAAWRTVMPLALAGVVRAWVTYPGLFAAGRLDAGTALLAGALPPLLPGARVLDYGCGAGAIGAAALAAEPRVALDMLDSDAVALEAVRENVPAARRILGARVADAGGARYQAILSNPPLHAGLAEDHALLEQLIADAPAALVPGGVLQLVVQRRVPLDRLLARHFARAEVVAETGRYRVWRAASP
jgi:16S rRNA (guanine1207-N2)-methyltransferase